MGSSVGEEGSEEQKGIIPRVINKVRKVSINFN
jgi:hypothetical protein